MKKSNKNLFKEKRDNYVKLKGYQIVVFDHIFWKKGKDFMVLIQNFIADTINYQEFEIFFSWLFEET